ncbi:MAG TPA: phosphoribosyltransferase family protein [Pyrinomonadaceae bacterium]|jgi:hypoxanthine phosphoribosyltransferase|nr:phosphoribosyltransferase family protein [Pyrinomonadaceae bacterium]
MNEQPVEIHSASEIAGRIEALAAEISQAPRSQKLTILGVQEDSFVFLADLLRSMSVPVRTAFLRYDRRAFGGLQDLSFTTQIDLRGRDVVLVEGVLDTGVTQEYLIKQLESRGAAGVRLCVLLDKPDRRRTSVEASWRAFETHEDYVVGYGLGFQDRWRELPYLATLALS